MKQLLREKNDGTEIDSSLLKNLSPINVIETSSEKTITIFPELSQEDNEMLNEKRLSI